MFDCIVGNPPYQKNDGGAFASAIPIYQYFVISAINQNPYYLSIIIPARWYTGGKGLDEFRDKMLNDNRILEIHDYAGENQCFPNVRITGGVCYFLWKRNYCGVCIVTNHNQNNTISIMKRFLLENNVEIFIRVNEAVSILRKVGVLSQSSFADIISTRKPFGLTTNIKGKPYSKDSDIKLYGYKFISYISKDDIKQNHNWIDKYKVMVSYAYGETNPYQIINKPFVAEKNSACTETYLVINPTNDIHIAENIVSYLKTKFVRFLISLLKNTQHATKYVYQFVPMQDFSKSWSDEELYKKYSLSQEEVDFIESRIKPMDIET